MKPLIAHKPFEAFTPDEYHMFVCNMYGKREKGTKPPKPPSPAPGLKLGRNKKGVLAITRTKKTRPFEYVLRSEMEALAKAAGVSLTETWNLFKSKNYIVTNTKMEAEIINTNLQEMPF